MTLLARANAFGARAIDSEDAEVILSPEADGSGYWIGCPSVLYEPEHGRFLLTCRERRPRGATSDRGWRCSVLASDDGSNFKEIWHIEKEQLSSTSMERFSLVPAPEGNGYLLYISYVDPADNRWRIDVLPSEEVDGFDPGRAIPVLSAASTGTEGVKDHWLCRVGPALYMYASFASATTLADGDRARAHEHADIYNAGVTTHPTGLATSLDGIHFDWRGEALGVGRDWDRYQARLTTVVALDGAYVGIYDGSQSAAENYEEKTGLAVTTDLCNWQSVSPAGPWSTSPHGTGALRYADAVIVDGDVWVYFECARPDGSHDLRRSKLARS